jgi:hypothetical protein
MSQPTAATAARTRAFARVIGPFLALVTLVIAIRLPDVTGLVDDLFANTALPWILGAMMLIPGLLVIAFHQYWRGFSAVLISLFGWFIALRGLTLMAFPSAIETGAGDALANPGLLTSARIFFGLMTLMGGWLTYVGWVSPGPVDNFSATGDRSASMSHGGNH